MPHYFARCRRFLHTFVLILFLILTLAFSAGTFLPIAIGPYPVGYRDRSVAPFFFSSFKNHTIEIYFRTRPMTPRAPGPAGGFHRMGQDLEIRPIIHGRGFTYTHHDLVENFTNIVTLRGHVFIIPDWMPASFFMASMFLLALPQIRRRFRRVHADPHAQPCTKCRYDLRAHLTGDKCPECGTSIAVARPMHRPF